MFLVPVGQRKEEWYHGGKTTQTYTATQTHTARSWRKWPDKGTRQCRTRLQCGDTRPPQTYHASDKETHSRRMRTSPHHQWHTCGICGIQAHEKRGKWNMHECPGCVEDEVRVLSGRPSQLARFNSNPTGGYGTGDRIPESQGPQEDASLLKSSPFK